LSPKFPNFNNHDELMNMSNNNVKRNLFFTPKFSNFNNHNELMRNASNQLSSNNQNNLTKGKTYILVKSDSSDSDSDNNKK